MPKQKKQPDTGKSGENSPIEELLELKRIQSPLIFVSTYEDKRIVEMISKALIKKRVAGKVYVWDSRGIITDASETGGPSIEMSERTVTRALLWYTQRNVSFDVEGRMIRDDSPEEHQLSESDGPAACKSVLIIKDFTHIVYERNGNGTPHSVSNVPNRIIKESVEHLKRCGRTIIVVSHATEVPPEILHEADYVKFPLPSLREFYPTIEAVASIMITSKRGRGGSVQSDADMPADGKVPKIELDDVKKEMVARELLGLTQTEARSILMMANIANAHEWDETLGHVERDFSFKVIRNGKASKLNRLSTLDLCESDATLDQIGGMDLLKERVAIWKKLFHPDVRKVGLKPPKGFLMVGPGGTGKTLVGEAIANTWELPAVMLDVSKCKGRYVGQSEGQLREALDRIDRMAPTVVIMDEFEKMWAGVQSSGETDSGVTSSMLGTFLKWMNKERSVPVVVLAMSNDVSNIPAPVLRRGRFDDIIYVGLPDRESRKEIFRIHLRKRTWDPDTLDLDVLADKTVGYSGSEIEHAVVLAIIQKVAESGFDRTKPVEMRHVIAGVEGVVPSIRSHRSDYEELRAWVDRAGITRSSSIDEDLGEANIGRPRGTAESAGEVEDISLD